MCLVIDANARDKVFTRKPHPDYLPVHQALYGRVAKARAVYGGTTLIKEYSQSLEALVLLRDLDAKGRTRRVPDATVDAEELIVKKLALCKSNDTHIVALVRAAKVGLVCGADKALETDMKNKALVDSPRGAIYKHPSHKHLIKKYCACI